MTVPCGHNDPSGSCVYASGQGSSIASTGSASVASDNRVSTAFSLPPGTFGQCLMAGLQQRSPALRRPAVQGEDLPHDAGTGEQHGHHRVGQGGQRTAHRMNRPRRDLVLPVLVPRHGRRLRRPGRSSGSGFASWMSPWLCAMSRMVARARSTSGTIITCDCRPLSRTRERTKDRAPVEPSAPASRARYWAYWRIMYGRVATFRTSPPSRRADGSTVRAALPAGFLMMSMSCPSLPRSLMCHPKRWPPSVRCITPGMRPCRRGVSVYDAMQGTHRA